MVADMIKNGQIVPSYVSGWLHACCSLNRGLAGAGNQWLHHAQLPEWAAHFASTLQHAAVVPCSSGGCAGLSKPSARSRPGPQHKPGSRPPQLSPLTPAICMRCARPLCCLPHLRGATMPCPAPPPQVTISLLQRAMDESGKHKFLIDGFPRNEENRASFEKQVRLNGCCGWIVWWRSTRGGWILRLTCNQLQS